MKTLLFTLLLILSITTLSGQSVVDGVYANIVFLDESGDEQVYVPNIVCIDTLVFGEGNFLYRKDNNSLTFIGEWLYVNNVSYIFVEGIAKQFDIAVGSRGMFLVFQECCYKRVKHLSGTYTDEEALERILKNRNITTDE